MEANTCGTPVCIPLVIPHCKVLIVIGVVPSTFVRLLLIYMKIVGSKNNISLLSFNIFSSYLSGYDAFPQIVQNCRCKCRYLALSNEYYVQNSKSGGKHRLKSSLNSKEQRRYPHSPRDCKSRYSELGL